MENTFEDMSDEIFSELSESSQQPYDTSDVSKTPSGEHLTGANQTYDYTDID